MRNWLYSLTPAIRGVVILAGSLFALAGGFVLWPIAMEMNSLMILVIVAGLFVLARFGFSSGVAWLRFSRELDADADSDAGPTASTPPLGPTEPNPGSANQSSAQPGTQPRRL